MPEIPAALSAGFRTAPPKSGLVDDGGLWNGRRGTTPKRLLIGRRNLSVAKKKTNEQSNVTNVEENEKKKMMRKKKGQRGGGRHLFILIQNERKSDETSSKPRNHQ